MTDTTILSNQTKRTAGKVLSNTNIAEEINNYDVQQPQTQQNERINSSKLN